jgi:preprotein translocase subunit SecB
MHDEEHQDQHSARATAFVDSSDYHVVPERIFLVDSTFADRSGPRDEPAPIPDDLGIVISVALHRLGRFRLTVAVTIATVGEDSPFDLSVTYAGQFRMHDTVPADNIEPLWGYIARDLAIKVLYPYLRQAVSELTDRWRGEKLFLPFIPIPLHFADGEELEVPLPADDAQVSLLEGLQAG